MKRNKLFLWMVLGVMMLLLTQTSAAAAQNPAVNDRASKQRPVNRAEMPGKKISRIDPALLDSPLIYHRAGYTERRLTFTSGDVSLAGSLVLPTGDGPFPAVVMIHGSGPDTRQIFWQTGDAQAFLDAGVAVFLYDKRGTGLSGGDWQTASLEDLADDAIAAVKLVQQQPAINQDQVGVFGVSQGGWLAPLAASRSDAIAFVIDVTGAGLPLANQEMWGTGNELHGRGYSDQAVATTMKVMHLLFSARPLLQRLAPADMYIWFKSFNPMLDPAGFWPEVEQPAFVAYGSKDSLVPTVESTAVIQNAFAQQDHNLSRLVIYPEAGHGIRLAFGQWAPGHIATMTDWLHATLNGHPLATPPLPDHIDTGSNRWYGLGAASTPWYVSSAVQLPLMLLFLLVFGTGLVTSLNPRARMASERFGHWSRLALGLASLINLALLGSLLNVIGFLAFADANGAGPAVPLSGYLPVLGGASIVLTLGLLFLLKDGRRRGLYGLVAGTAVLFIPFLAYWNVLGPPL